MTHDYVTGFTVRVLRGTPVDDPFGHGGDEGDRELDWTTPARVGPDYERCPIALETAIEAPTSNAPLALSEELTVYVPYSVDVTSADRVEVLTGPYRGTYEVDGLPGWWLNPYTGDAPGCAVKLGRKTGG